MIQPVTASLSTRAKVGLTVGLSMLAVLGNVLSVPLFYGVDFIFGSIAVMLAVALLGTLPALTVAIVGGLYTVALWGHPYALVIFTVEALVVGMLHRRAGTRSLIETDLLFWLFAGVPLQLLFYRQMLGMDWNAVLLIALKQPLNGIFNALVAGLLILGLQLSRYGRQRLGGLPRLESLLFHIMLASVLVAGAVPIVYDGFSRRGDQELFVQSRLHDKAQAIAVRVAAQPERTVESWQAEFEHLPQYGGTGLALLASDGRVQAQLGTITSNLPAAGSVQQLQGGLSIWLPDGDASAMQRWKRGRYLWRLPVAMPQSTATVIVEEPAAPLVESFERGRTSVFMLLFGMSLAGIFTAKFICRWLTRPLAELASASDAFSSQIAAGIQPNLPKTSVQEYSSLSDTLCLMSRRLATGFQELRRTKAGLEEQVERRTAELARLSRVASETTNGVVMTDTRGKIEWVNDGFTRLTGYMLDEIAGLRPGHVLQGANTDPDTVAAMANAVKQGQSFDVDVINYHKSGEEYWIHISCNPLRDRSGCLQGFIAIETDITREKKDAERIGASERRLASVIEGTNIGTWEWNVETGQTVFNERWAEIVGYTLDELGPISIQTWLDLVHPDDNHHSEVALKRHFAGESDHYDVQCRMQHKDGHWVWVHDRGRVVTWTESGEPLMMYGTHADVTEQKHAESELNQFKNTLDRTLDSVFMFDARTLQFSYCNEGALQQVGYSQDELLQMQPLDIKPEITEPQFRELIAPLLAGEQASLTFETVHEHKNGTRLPVEIFLQYVAPENEQPRFVAIVRDLTERKEEEAERDRIASLLRNVLNAASEVSIIGTDREGLVTTFNPGSERMLGYSAEEMVGKQTPALIHKPAEVIARGKELSEQYGRPIEGFRVFVEVPELEGAERREWTYVHKDGREFPVSLAVTTIRNESGAVVGYVGLAEDISERKRAEAELHDQAEHTQAILDNMVDGIMTIDEFGAIDSFNPAAERIFGYQADQAVGRNVTTLMAAPCHDQGPQSSDDDQMATIKGVGREVEGQRSDGSRFPMELTVTEITRRGKRMYVGMARDISERKRIERMKSEFVSTVSHELRTPLTAISGSLGLITGGALGRLPQQAGDMIDIAHKNSQRLTYLINDLLDIEKLSAGKLQFDIQQQPLMPLVEQAVQTNHSYGAKRRVALTLKQAALSTEVRVDSQRLSQVLSNLLSNAIKYSPEDGTVYVSVESRAGWSRVSVQDFGPGIPAQFRDKIFEKFAQADSSDTRTKGGTGLGLAISKQLIERMGGRIDFESVEGQGACFFIELPNLYPIETGGDSAVDSTPAVPVATRKRVLQVDDDPGTYERLLSMINDQVDLELASSIADAHIRISREDFDAVVLNAQLPDGSGWKLLPELRQLQPEARIVILAATDLMSSQSELVDAVLTKSSLTAERVKEAIIPLSPKEQVDEFIGTHSLRRR